MQRREGTYLQALALPFHFWLLLLPSYFCTFISNAFSSHLLLFKQRKEKNTKKKKCRERERAYLQAPALPSHFWLLLLPSFFCPFVSNTFYWHLLLLKQKKKKTIEKKKKNAKKGGSLPLLLSFLHLG